jgi:hypothetical protein
MLSHATFSNKDAQRDSGQVHHFSLHACSLAPSGPFDNVGRVSLKVGGLLPHSLLMTSVQRAGELDMVLRTLEDDFFPSQVRADEIGQFSSHYQLMLSELWVGDVDEILRLLKDRHLAPDGDAFTALAHDLRLLRIPLEKHEIAGEKTRPLLLQSQPPNTAETDIYQYSPKDPQRAHIMPSAISHRGSVMWQALDVKSGSSYWLERRALSERIIALWADERKGRSQANPTAQK